MRVFSPVEVLSAIERCDPIAAMERAFAAYSRGDGIAPPPGELIFENPPGEVHVKYGYLRGDDIYVVKVASGFSGNVEKGVPTSDGLVMAFRRDTGEPAALLLDRGRLTDIRTAAAGAVCAKHLALASVEAVGVLGTGIQAELQVRWLKKVRAFQRVLVWGRNAARVDDLRKRLEADGLTVEPARSPAEVAAGANLIVTATASHTPLLAARDVRPGTHITAMGADTMEKTELAPDLLATADVLAVDSRSAGAVRGDLAKGLATGAIGMEKPVELGALIDGRAVGRTHPTQITVALLTGLAVQDAALAADVLRVLR